MVDWCPKGSLAKLGGAGARADELAVEYKAREGKYEPYIRSYI